jgi:hypothetical protein
MVNIDTSMENGFFQELRYKMKRKITKNKHQYKVSLPVEMIRKLSWDEATPISFKEVETPLGKGLLILRETEDAMRLDVK